MNGDTAEPVGVLIVGRKRPGFDQEWNAIMIRRSLAALEEMGYRPVSSDAPVVDDGTLRCAVSGIRASGCDALVVLQPSLGNGQLGMTLAQEWTGPIVLWATPERTESETVSSCSLVAQHLWGSILRLSKHPFEIVYGDPADESVREEVARAIRICRVSTRLARTKLGLIGTQAPGFISMAPDGFLMKRTMGVQLHVLSLPQFFARARAIDSAAVRDDVQRVQAVGLPMNGVSIDDLATNSRFYLALRELIAEESLDAMAVQCWPEFVDVEGQWPYLAFSRLSEEHYPIALEGDVDGALTSLVGELLGAGPAFIADWLEHDAHTINLWHPGIAPLRMCNAVGEIDGPSLGRHFNNRKPLVLEGVLKVNLPVTVARLWRCDGAYRMTAFEGRSVSRRRKLPGNTALIELDSAPGRLFDDMLHEGMPHHVVMFFGHHADVFRRTSRTLGIEWS